MQKILIVMICFLTILTACNKEVASNVDIAYNASVFQKIEENKVIPLTEAEVIEIVGQPQEIEEWNYEYLDKYGLPRYFPMKTLYYNDGTYVFNFTDDKLVRLQIIDDFTFENKEDIIPMFGFKKNRATLTTADTGVAIRYNNCGIHDLWVQNIEENTITIIAFTYISGIYD